MRLASLGSGSKGNATLIELENRDLLLIDCGFSVKETAQRLQRLGADINKLIAILVTHEHSDHSKGVIQLAKHCNIDIYSTQGTWLELIKRQPKHQRGYKCLKPDVDFVINDCCITPISVPHDAREPVQFLLSHADNKLGVLTDLGSISQHVINCFDGCHSLFIEANHDLDMLENGLYHRSLKHRVASNYGHLNNQQTAALVDKINHQKQLKNLIVGHLSEKNNHLSKVKQALQEVTKPIQHTYYACQQEGLSWITL